jgi:hypothetical protein
MRLDRLKRRWPAIAIGLVAFVVGLAVILSGRQGVGYGIGVAALGLLLALISIFRALG